MRLKFILAFVIFTSPAAKSQCTATQVINSAISTVTNITNGPEVIKICIGGVVYDTIGNGARVYYMDGSSQLILKSAQNMNIYMKSGSKLVLKTGCSGQIYYENGATIMGSLQSGNKNTCNSVSYPGGSECIALSNEERKNESHLFIWPSPADQELYLSLPPAEDGEVEIYNSTGQKLYSVALAENQKAIDVSALNAGIYFLKLPGSKQTISKAFIISR